VIRVLPASNDTVGANQTVDGAWYSLNRPSVNLAIFIGQPDLNCARLEFFVEAFIGGKTYSVHGEVNLLTDIVWQMYCAMSNLFS